MAFKTELTNRTSLQQLRICRTVRCVTSGTAFNLQGSMFVNERALLVGMATDARDIGPDRQSGLFQLKSAVRIMTVTAVHRAFEYFMVEWLTELGLHLGVTTDTQLGFALPKHRFIRLVGTL
jgi:hypothetical protein